MRKKLLIIIALVLAVLIIVFATIMINSSGKNEPAGKNLDTVAGVEDSIFNEESDDDNSGSEESLNDDKGSNKAANVTSDSNNTKNENSINKDESSKNDSSAVKPSGEMDYQIFMAMSPSKQQAYMESFGDIDKFFNWYNKAKKQYEKEHPDIEIDGDSVTLE